MIGAAPVWESGCATGVYNKMVKFEGHDHGKGTPGMNTVRRLLLPVICVLIFAAASAVVFKSDASSQSTPLKGDDLVSRGKYLVQDVAMCVECHTPRDDKGRLLEDQNLMGAPVPVEAPAFPQMKWAAKAPAIAGLIGYTEQEGVRLLTSGETRDGRVPDPPMPPFRMSVPDAEAVVAYLKSLSSERPR